MEYTPTAAGTRIRLTATALALALAVVTAGAVARPTSAAASQQPAIPPTTIVSSSPVAAGKGPSAPGAGTPAATDGPTGPVGNFSASSLSPEGSWTAGGSDGSFAWSYPITVPPASAGAVAPRIALSYDSAAVDGETGTTNNQSSWIGQGWGYEPGFVERTYRSCSDDTTLPSADQTPDSCWAGQILALSLNGKSTAIVADDHGGFRLQADDGSQVTQLTGDSNGTHNGEYWRVTTTDGTQYYFGQDKAPGAPNSTNSVLTEPVYGAHPGDPCNAADFASSSCTQGWRWNLDYVVDVHGNATVYYYDRETNYYTPDNGQNGAVPVQYVRGGELDHIDYGLRLENGTVYGSPVPDVVKFLTAERCISSTFSCDPSQFTAPNANYWPDTPQNLQCQSTSCQIHSPTMWTTKRLTTITTKVLNASTGQYQSVDSYALTQQFPSTGDEELTLSNIVHTGYDSSGANPVSEPPATFEGQLYDNRIPGYNHLPGLAHWRMYNIATQTGETISVTYNTPQCTPSNLPPASDTAAQQQAFASTNTMSCYPVFWTPPGYTGPIFDYFNKYTVASVQVSDPNALSPKQITHYYYLGGAAWHYDDNELVKPTQRTYGQFRGYAQVQTTTGDTGHTSNGVADGLTLTQNTYFRGMDQDTLPNNGVRSAVVHNTFGGQVADADTYAGRSYESQTFNGATLGSNGLPAAGPELSATVTAPEVVATTATRTRTAAGLPPLLAQIVGTASSTAYTDLAAGGTRSTATASSYDSAGRVVATQSSGTNVPTTCTTTSYADNSTNWLRDKVAETVTAAQSCPSPVGAPLTASAVLRDRRNYYDQSGSLGAAPSLGDLTRTDVASANNGGTLTWIADDATATYDASGRVLTATDALGHTARTAYTPADGGSLTRKAVANPICAVSSTLAGCATTSEVYDAGRGVVTQSTDAANHKTSAQYDALGRLIAVWTPGFAPGLTSASTTYSYTLRNNGPEAVTTNTLVDDGAAGNNLNYRSSVALYDAMGQKLQTQSVGENGAMLASDSKYDSHGWVVDANNGYATNGTPGPTLISVADSAVNSRTQTAYDGSGRATLVTPYNGLTPTSAVQTVYGGDRTSTIGRLADGRTFDPAVTASTKFTDVRGGTTELDQYSGAPTVSGSTVAGPATGSIPGTPGTLATTYTLDALGQQTGMKDSASNQWTTGYDLLGRAIKRTDPDTGTTTTVYDGDGNVASTTDADNKVLSYQYDPLNRRTGEYDSLTQNASTQTASWLWDTEQKGRLTSTSTTNVTLADGTTGTIVEQVDGYDGAGREGGSIVTVPGGETGLAGTYTTTTANTSTGLITSTTPAALPGSPAETVTTTFNALGDATSNAGYNAYVSATSYTPYGETAQLTLGASNAPVWLTYAYTAQTRQVAETNVSAQLALPQLDDTKYAYNPDQRITSVTDTQGYGSTAPVQQQCYSYDTLDRLTEAYTAAHPTSDGSCPTDPATAGKSAVGGPEPYWSTWTFDQLGQRQSQDQHVLGGQSTDATATYSYGQGGHAHALNSVAIAGPAGQTNLTGYVYDNAGDATTYPASGASGTQTLTWNPQGRMASDTTTSGTTTTQVDDAGGGQLITRNSTTGTDTLYLPGEQLSYSTKTGVATSTRYYTYGSTVVAERVGGGNPQYLVGDQHGTDQLSVDSVTMSTTRRQLDPYGNQVGPVSGGNWPDQRGFLDQPQDASTGLVNDGARQYDPATGRFLTTDPLLEAGSPQQLNGYAYAAGDPVNGSDPSGAMTLSGGGGGSYDGTCQSDNSCGSNGSGNTDQGSSPTDQCWGPGGNWICGSSGNTDAGNSSSDQCWGPGGNWICGNDADSAAVTAAQSVVNAVSRVSQTTASHGSSCGIFSFLMCLGGVGESGGSKCLLAHSDGSCVGSGYLKAFISQVTGRGSGGVCLSGSAAVGLAIGASLCLQQDSTGHYGLTFSPQVGLGGIGATVSIDPTISNADTLNQLSGWSAYGDAAVGELGYVHGGLSYGGTHNNAGLPVVSSQGGVGVGISLIPVVLSGGVSYTFVIPLGQNPPQ
ncbi:RHS repeat-associated protein [Catenulispora sp. GAS73]|uniref:RHS repeat-associated core domain-containing protein n=1 Tax=Catenulispora sp. GAS73 TaxID=3156269 RepID=UPI00351818E3